MPEGRQQIVNSSMAAEDYREATRYCIKSHTARALGKVTARIRPTEQARTESVKSTGRLARVILGKCTSLLCSRVSIETSSILVADQFVWYGGYR